MITRLDHIAVAVRDFDAAADAYRRLLGREPEVEPREGAARAWFHLGDMALEVISPDGEGAAGDRVRAQLDAKGEGIWAVAFAAPEPTAFARLLIRRGIRADPQPPPSYGVVVDPVATAGLQVFVVLPGEASTSPAVGDEAASVETLDHIVVHTPNPDRALAIYGAKFGLDLRLDRANEQWGARQLFFRCGDAVFEVGASLKAPATPESLAGPDRFGGLAWRVSDPDAAQSRLAAAGFDVSEVRSGRKPGTKVFTVRDAPGGVPTLMIQQSPQMEAA